MAGVFLRSPNFAGIQKHKTMLQRIFIVGILLSLTGLSCEKDTHIRLHDASQSLVIEATIENGKAPRVVLSHSLNYFSAINADILKKLFVHNAKISVTDSVTNRRISLVEKQVDTLMGNHYYYYEPENKEAFKGQCGHTYRLKIQAEDHNYESTTTIPSDGFYLDSIWWVHATKGGKPDSSKVFLMARIYDPPHLGNYARYFTRKNEGPFYPGLASVADDEITNGKIFDFQISPGVDKNTGIDPDEYGYFQLGDTVILKFCNIDEATYRFWSTWEYAWSNNSNPFATPTSVEGNIPGALGYWGGYEAQYKKLIIPR